MSAIKERSQNCELRHGRLTVRLSYGLSVCLSVWNNSAPHWKNA